MSNPFGRNFARAAALGCLLTVSAGYVCPAQAPAPSSVQPFGGAPRRVKRHVRKPATQPVVDPTPTPPAQPTTDSPIVVVNSPQDTIPLDPTKIHEVRIAINYLCVITLPEPAVALITGNQGNFETWALEEEQEAAEPDDKQVKTRQNGRFILCKPVKILEKNPGLEVETNLTVRLQSERLLFFRLRVAEADRTTYRIRVRDVEAEERARRDREVEAARAREIERLKAEAADSERQARERLRGVSGAALAAGSASTARDRQGEAATPEADIRLVCDRAGRFAVAAVAVRPRKRGKPVALGAVEWLVDGVKRAPDFSDRVWPTESDKPADTNGGFRCDDADGREIQIAALVTVGGKPVRVTATLAPAPAKDPVRVEPPAAPSEPRIVTVEARGPAPSSAPPNVVADGTGPLADRLRTMNVRSAGVGLAADKQVVTGIHCERLGATAVVACFLERKLGASDLHVEPPMWAADGKPIRPTRAVPELPSVLGTRPVSGGYVFELPGPGPVTLTGTISIGGKPYRWSWTFPPAAAEPTGAPAGSTTQPDGVLASANPPEQPEATTERKDQPANPPAGTKTPPPHDSPVGKPASDRSAAGIPQGSDSRPKPRTEQPAKPKTDVKEVEPAMLRVAANQPPAQPDVHADLSALAVEKYVAAIKRVESPDTLVKIFLARAEKGGFLVVGEAVNLGAGQVVAVELFTISGDGNAKTYFPVEAFVEGGPLETGDRARFACRVPRQSLTFPLILRVTTDKKVVRDIEIPL